MRHIIETKSFTSTAKFLQSLAFIVALLVTLPSGAANLIPAKAAASGKQLEFRQELKDHLNTLDRLVDKDAQADGVTVDDRVVVVTFFASWCPPCLHEFKALNEITDQLDKNKFSVVAVNVFEEFDDNDEARMAKFLQTTQPEFAVLKGTVQSAVLKGTVQSREMFGDIRRIPTLLVFDREGKLAFDFVHARGATKQSVDAEELLGAIRPLL